MEENPQDIEYTPCKGVKPLYVLNWISCPEVETATCWYLVSPHKLLQIHHTTYGILVEIIINTAERQATNMSHTAQVYIDLEGRYIYQECPGGDYQIYQDKLPFPVIAIRRINRRL